MNKTATRIKLAGLVISSSIILSFQSLPVQTVFLAIILSAILLNHKNNKVLERILLIFPAGLTIFVLQILFSPLANIQDKLIFSTLVFMRLLNVSLIVFYFSATVSPSEIVSAFSFLSEDIKLMLAMTFYLVPLIFSESKKIQIVQKSRGLKSFTFNIFPLIVPLLHRVFNRAQVLSLTIVSRGYRG